MDYLPERFRIRFAGHSLGLLSIFSGDFVDNKPFLGALNQYAESGPATMAEAVEVQPKLQVVHVI